MNALLLAASIGGFLIAAGVIVAVILVIGGVVTLIGKGTRREERGGNVHPEDDPRERAPRA